MLIAEVLKTLGVIYQPGPPRRTISALEKSLSLTGHGANMRSPMRWVISRRFTFQRTSPSKD